MFLNFRCSVALSISMKNDIIKYYKNAHTLEYDIKIINTKNIKVKADSTIVILAWNFSKEIEMRLKKQNIRNAKLLIPLPKIKIRKL